MFLEKTDSVELSLMIAMLLNNSNNVKKYGTRKEDRKKIINEIIDENKINL